MNADFNGSDLTVPDQNAEYEPESAGALFFGSGIALVHHEDDDYFIQPSARAFGEVVHKMAPSDFRHLHMFNLHTEPHVKLTEADIGQPPFEALIARLEYEQELSLCLLDIDRLLDPMERTSPEFRYGAALCIDDLLKKFPDSRGRILAKIAAFIPPEDYAFDTVAILKGAGEYQAMMEEDDEPLNEEDRKPLPLPDEPFESVFPLLYAVMQEAHALWEETVKIPDIQRMTREQIQDSHDRTKKIASENYVRRATKARDTLQQCLADISDPARRTKWLEHFPYKMDLEDAKGEIILRTQRGVLAHDREEFADADTRMSGILKDYDKAIECMREATLLLPKIEEILGEIHASNLVA